MLPAVCMCTGVVSSSEGVFWCILDVDERTAAELLELLITVRISTSVSFAARLRPVSGHAGAGSPSDDIRIMAK